MTAYQHEPGSARSVREIRLSLQADRSPRNVRACLPAADRPAFDAEYSEALRRAGDELDLTPLHECVEAWRRTAILKADPEDYAEMMATAERIQQRSERGEPTGGTPWDDALDERLRARLAAGQ